MTTADRVLRCVAVLTFVIPTIASLGCELTGNDDETTFVIQVESITAPSTVPSDETLKMRFWGGIGPDGCWRLAEVEKGEGPGLLELRFLGERTQNGDCPQMPTSLEHEERVAPPFEDPFTIRVLQPSGDLLEEVVRVE